MFGARWRSRLRYQSISLMSVLYKIITKVLSGRIKKVLQMVINVSQSNFLGDKGMLDSVVVANEVVEELRRKGRRGFLKVDFKKAHDSMRWSFLYDMLQRLGFHSLWIKWIKGCVESVSVSVLVNGSPTKEFFPKRGLRQDDPLAPFFIFGCSWRSDWVSEASC